MSEWQSQRQLLVYPALLDLISSDVSPGLHFEELKRCLRFTFAPEAPWRVSPFLALVPSTQESSIMAAEFKPRWFLGCSLVSAILTSFLVSPMHGFHSHCKAAFYLSTRTWSRQSCIFKVVSFWGTRCQYGRLTVWRLRWPSGLSHCSVRARYNTDGDMVIRLVRAVGSRFSDRDLLFDFHKFIAYVRGQICKIYKLE